MLIVIDRVEGIEINENYNLLTLISSIFLILAVSVTLAEIVIIFYSLINGLIFLVPFPLALSYDSISNARISVSCLVHLWKARKDCKRHHDSITKLNFRDKYIPTISKMRKEKDKRKKRKDKIEKKRLRRKENVNTREYIQSITIITD